MLSTETRLSVEESRNS